MIKSALKLIAIAVVAILAYNYFFGTPEEKKSSQKIVNEFKDLGGAVFDLLKNEKEKYDEGKYDEALSKIGDFLNEMKGKAGESKELLDQISRLQDKKDALVKSLENEKEQADSPTTAAPGENQPRPTDYDGEIKRLMEETEEVVKKMEK